MTSPEGSSNIIWLKVPKTSKRKYYLLRPILGLFFPENHNYPFDGFKIMKFLVDYHIFVCVATLNRENNKQN